MNRPPRVREPHHEHRELGQLPVQPDADPAEVHLRLLARGMQLGDRHDLAAGLELAPQAGDAGADRRLGDRRAVLIDEALPDPPRRVPLLAGRAQVGDEPLPDDLHVRDRASAPLGTPACAAAAAPTAAPAVPCAGARAGGPPARVWTAPSLAVPVGYARTTPPSTHSSSFARGRFQSPERSCWMGRGWGQFRGSKRLQVGPNQSSVPNMAHSLPSPGFSLLTRTGLSWNRPRCCRYSPSWSPMASLRLLSASCSASIVVKRDGRLSHIVRSQSCCVGPLPGQPVQEADPRFHGLDSQRAALAHLDDGGQDRWVPYRVAVQRRYRRGGH